MKQIHNIIGWYGAIALLCGYFFISFGLLETSSWIYHLINLTGAYGIVHISLKHTNYPPAVLNGVWMVIAGVSLIKIFL